MHYDLYGNSYRTAQEAMNAEMAQCAQIDADIQARELKNINDRLRSIEQNQNESSCYDIDFGGNLKAQIQVLNGQITVLKCINGYGDSIDLNDIFITPV